MGDCRQRKWAGLRVAIAAALVALGLASCRVGAFHADALTEPFPDGALDRGAGDAAGVDSSQPCDLLAQNCADHTQFCYPVDSVAGATQCKPSGSGPVTSACASNLECDGREACVIVPETERHADVRDDLRPRRDHHRLPAQGALPFDSGLPRGVLRAVVAWLIPCGRRR